MKRRRDIIWRHEPRDLYLIPPGVERLREIKATDPVLYQINQRIRDDSTALNTSGGWLAAEDANYSDLALDTVYRVRGTIDEQNAKNGVFITDGETLQYRRNGGSWTNLGDGNVNLAASSFIDPTTNNTCTTQLLAAAGSGSFIGTGPAWESGGSPNAVTYGKNDYWEYEFAFQVPSSGVFGAGDTLEFRFTGGYMNATETNHTKIVLTVSSTVAVSASDGVEMTDAATATIDHVEFADDGVEMSDDGAAVLTLPQAETDGVEMSDAATAAKMVYVDGDDGVELGDSATEAITMPEAGTDGVEMSDAATAVVTGSITVDGDDGVEVGDDAAVQIDFTVAGDDGVEVGDDAAAVLTLPEAGDDGVEVGDDAAAVVTTPVAGLDGVEAGDAATVTLTLTPGATDGVKVGDSASAYIPTAAPKSHLRITWVD